MDPLCPQHKRQMLGLCLFACISIFAGNAAHGQSVPNIPASTDPAKIHAPLSRGVEPQPQVGTAVTDARAAQIGDIVIPGADQVVFVLVNLKIEGMEAYPQGKFLGDYVGLLGRPVTLQQIIDVANKINRTYREDGYILSRAFFPEQDITEGMVTLNVVEGRVARVSMPDVAAEKQLQLQPYLDRMANLYPFNIKEFEHWLLTMNNLPGAKFRSVLTQPKDLPQPGGIEILLLEEDVPASVMAEVNNQGSRYAGPWQTSFSYDQPEIFTDYDQLSLRATATLPVDEVKFVQLGYKYPLAAIPGLAFNTHANWGGTQSGSNLQDLEVKGYAREWRLGLSYDALLSRRTNWLMYLNLDFKNARSKVLGDELYEDRLRVLRVSTALQHIDDYDGATLANLEVSQGLNLFGAKETGSTNLSRDDGRSDFTKLALQISRLQNLPLNFQLLAQVAGQYAISPLLSAEEFGFGGVPNGRGYDPSELTGDHGLAATLELRYNGIPDWNHLLVQPYTYIDFGKVWQRGDAPENAQSALSAGVGSRLDYRTYSMNVMLGLPLTYEADNPPKYANPGSPRFLVSLSKQF